MRSLIDIVDFSVEELQQLLDTACDIVDNPESYRNIANSQAQLEAAVYSFTPAAQPDNQ